MRAVRTNQYESFDDPWVQCNLTHSVYCTFIPVLDDKPKVGEMN